MSKPRFDLVFEEKCVEETYQVFYRADMTLLAKCVDLTLKHCDIEKPRDNQARDVECVEQKHDASSSIYFSILLRKIGCKENAMFKNGDVQGCWLG